MSVLKSGSTSVALAEDECCAVLLLKNATYFLPDLLAHHRLIGVKHFLVIDNGSTDGTQEMLAREPDLTVVENRLPAASYEVMLRGYVPRRFVQGGWFLIVDSDEMFDPPPGCGGRIGPLLRYMEAHRHTSMLAHALDMFCNAPVSESSRWSYAEAIRNLSHYSLGQLDKLPYDDPAFILQFFLKDNVTDGPQHFWSGGIRREIFGESPFLTRHNLIRNVPGGPQPGHVHAVRNVRVSDVTASFRHYKFTGDYISRDRRQVAESVWQHGEDALRLARYDERGSFAIRSETQQIYRGVEALLEQGFLKTSERFQAFVARDRQVC